MKTLKVSNSSKAYSVATSIAENVKTDGVVQVLSIGAASTYEANKAIIHAKGLLASSGLKMICIPTFEDVEIDDSKTVEASNVNNENGPSSLNNDEKNLDKRVRTAVKWTIRSLPEEY